MIQTDVSRDDFFWILQGLCTVHCKPFSLPIAQQQLAPPYNIASLSSAASGYGLEARTGRVGLGQLHRQTFPMVAWLKAGASDQAGHDGRVLVPALLLQADGLAVLVLDREKASSMTLSLAQFSAGYSGYATRVFPGTPRVSDADNEAQASQARRFHRWGQVSSLGSHRWGQVLPFALHGSARSKMPVD